jgi:hypothetical protein
MTVVDVIVAVVPSSVVADQEHEGSPLTDL